MRAFEYLTQHAFAQHALVAAIAIGTVCSLLSVIVVLKRMAFIGQGISHAGFGGVGLALFLGVAQGWPQDLVVVGYCLIAATIIGAMSRRRRVEADTIIGVILVASMALGVLLNSLRRMPWYVAWQGEAPPVSYEQLLFGSIVNVSFGDALGAVAVAVGVLLVAATMFKPLLFFAFDETTSRVFGVRTGIMRHVLLALLTVTIVVSMKLAGVILVTALLVIPGATAIQLSARLGRVFVIALVVGLIGTVGGLLLSLTFDELPPGPFIVGLLVAQFLAAHLYAAVRGRAAV